MKKPTPPPEEPVSYEQFRSTILASWFADDNPSADTNATHDPREAAGMAAHLAVTATGARKGTVLISAADGSLAKAAMSYLRAFFEDQPALQARVKLPVGSDTIALRGGGKILVSADRARRFKDVRSEIRLDAGVTEMPTRRELARSILAIVTEYGAGSPEVAQLTKQLGPQFAAIVERMATRDPAEQFAAWEAQQQFVRGMSQQPPPTSVPIVPRPEVPEAFVSEEEQFATMERKEMAGWGDRHHKPVIHRWRPK